MKNLFILIIFVLGLQVGYTQICNKSQLSLNLQNGLVAYYPFCGNANDISGFGNNGIIAGASLTSDRFGRANNAYSFNGKSSQIKVPQHTSLEPRDEISVSCWILPQYQVNEPSDININDATQIIRKGDGGSPGYHLSWSNRNNKRLESHYYGSWGNIVNGTSNENYKYNWQHIVMTYSTRTKISRLFINGTIISSQTCLNQLEHTDDLYIGGFRNYQFFKGKIDNIGIWNRELTLNEVRQLYNEQLIYENAPFIGFSKSHKNIKQKFR